MKTWYNVEIQMAGENERNEVLDRDFEWELGFMEEDIDERESYRMTAIFTSEDTPGKMKINVVRLMNRHPEIHYIDVMFRYDNENVPSRFVIWQDGRVQNYKGRIVFEEDVDHE